jgi:hypothetical protein
LQAEETDGWLPELGEQFNDHLKVSLDSSVTRTTNLTFGPDPACAFKVGTAKTNTRAMNESLKNLPLIKEA